MPAPLHIGIDLRPLDTAYRTGVGEYARELLDAVFRSDTTNHYYLFYYAASTSLIPALWSQPNIHLAPVQWPRKLLHALLFFFQYPKLDQLVIKNLKLQIKNLDIWFSPNLHFTALSPNVRHILLVHDLSFHFFPNFYTIKQRLWHRLINPVKQCQKAEHIIVPSENTKQDIIQYYRVPPEKITALYPGLPVSFTDPETRLNDIKKKYDLPNRYILFLGTIEPRKNILGLIAAFESRFCAIAKSGILDSVETESGQSTAYSLVIAGAPGWKNHAIMKHIRKSPAKNNIKLLGYIDPADKPSLYQNSSLFVYPSFYEGFGFPVLEAMASGIPVIASNRSSLPEVTGSAAYLVNPHRPDEIIAGLKYLLGDQEARAHAIKKGLEQAKIFSWEKTAKNLLSLFNSN